MVKKRQNKRPLKLISVFFFLCFFVYSLYLYESKEVTIEESLSNRGEILQGEHFDIDSDVKLYFCPRDNCTQVFLDVLDGAKSQIDCALYDLSDENVISALSLAAQDKFVRVIIDDGNSDRSQLSALSPKIELMTDAARKSKYNNEMHNKFCVIDNETVLLGSANPTDNGLNKNNNNILILHSKELAQNYVAEFEQMHAGLFGESKENVLSRENTTLNFGNQSYVLSSYFCPENECEEKLLKVLEGAKEEILFASFVLTLDGVENILEEKAKSGVLVEGIVEKRNVNALGSRVLELNETFPIFTDSNPNSMHHKFFVVDGRFVVTGSMNPSKSGVSYNDENILIIENEELAGKFRSEVLGLINES